MVLQLLKSWARVAFSPKYLMLTNIVTGSTLMVTGDFVQQHAVHLNNGTEMKHDWERSKRVMVLALCFLSPLSHCYYKWLDKTITIGSRGQLVAKKLVIDTATGPAFASSYIVGINILEGNSAKSGIEEYKKKFIHFLKLDLFLWMPVQAINFYFVPAHYRMLFVGCAALTDSFCYAHIKQMIYEDELA